VGVYYLLLKDICQQIIGEMKTELQLNIINVIRNIRYDNNMSQGGLGDILGISYGMVGNIESTKYKQKYSLKQINKICEEFNYSLENIFLTEDELKKSKNEIIKLLITKIIEYNG
jgi:putative transcriptional regulator